MVYVLIVLGLAVVIAPLMSAMPSKSQRAKAALRDQARTCNLRVSCARYPYHPGSASRQTTSLPAMKDDYRRRFTWLAGMSVLCRLMESGTRRLAYHLPLNGCRLCPRVLPLSSCQNRL